MPLLILTGYPTSGITYRASQLAKGLAELHPSWKIQIITSHTDDPSHPRSVYDESNSKLEKETRGLTYSAVKRALGKETLVIVDGLNYIKGYRYQLWCEARALGTGCCVVHIGTPISTCEAINNARLSQSNPTQSQATGAEPETETEPEPDLTLANPNTSPAYSPETHKNLIFRYEEPSQHSRWDKPLFTILWDDAEPPYSEIHAVLAPQAPKSRSLTPKSANPTNTETTKPQQETTSLKNRNAATHLPPSNPANALYTLDKTTQTITTHLISLLSSSNPDDDTSSDLHIPSIPLTTETLLIPSTARQTLSQPKLQRLRRQFIQLQRAMVGNAGQAGFLGGGLSEGEIAGAYVRFLGVELGA